MCVATLRGHKGSVRALALHGGLLVSASSDRSLIVWKQWQPKRTISLDVLHFYFVHLFCMLFQNILMQAEVTCLLSVSQLLLSGGEDGCIRMWNSDFEELYTLRAHTGIVTRKSVDFYCSIQGLLPPCACQNPAFSALQRKTRINRSISGSGKIPP